MKSGKVFIDTTNVWLAWYPLRGLRCQHRRGVDEFGLRYFEVAVGPLYFSYGPGCAPV